MNVLRKINEAAHNILYSTMITFLPTGPAHHLKNIGWATGEEGPYSCRRQAPIILGGGRGIQTPCMRFNLASLQGSSSWVHPVSRDTGPPCPAGLDLR